MGIDERLFDPLCNRISLTSEQQKIKNDVRNAVYHPEKIEEKGEHTMAEEEKKDTPTPEKEEKEEFVLTDEQNKFLDAIGYPKDSVKDKALYDELHSLYVEKDGKWELKETALKALEKEGKKEEDIKDMPLDELKKLTPIEVSGEEKEPEPTVDDDWVKRKKAYYDALSTSKAITDYEVLRADGLFSAKFNDTTITYSSPTTVSVSQDAKVAVFETIVRDPDNRGRPINFSATMSNDMKARLFAACVLNGALLGENAPESLSDEQKDLLKTELGDARYNTFLEKYKELKGPKDDTTKTPKVFSDAEIKEIKEKLGNQYEMAAMKADGRITLQPRFGKIDGKDVMIVHPVGKDEDVAKYKELTAKSAEDTKFLKEKWQENPAQFGDVLADAIKDIKEKKSPTDTLSNKLDAIKAKVEADKQRDAGKDSAEHKEWKANRDFIREERDQIMAAKLGIQDKYETSDGTTYKPLSADEKDKYIEQMSISSATYKRLYDKHSDKSVKLEIPEACTRVDKKNEATKARIEELAKGERS